jgi:hypothetical protein
MRPQGLKPALNFGALRGAEAPLFHGTAHIREFFRNPWKPRLPSPFVRIASGDPKSKARACYELHRLSVGWRVTR